MNRTSGTITSVELLKKHSHKYRIYIDGEYAGTIHEDVLIRHRLSKGVSLFAEQWQAVLRDEERQGAYECAVRWLGNRQRTEQEMRAYLRRKSYEEALIDDCMARLRSQHYLDDARFSRIAAEEQVLFGGKGRQWIKHELLHKGVEAAVVDDALAGIGAEDELAAAVKLAAKRWTRLQNDHEATAALRKLYPFLRRRGFPPETAREAIRLTTGRPVDFGEDDGWDWE